MVYVSLIRIIGLGKKNPRDHDLFRRTSGVADSFTAVGFRTVLKKDGSGDGNHF